MYPGFCERVLQDVLSWRLQGALARFRGARVCQHDPRHCLRKSRQKAGVRMNRNPHLLSLQHSCLLRHGRLTICAFNV